MINPLPVRKTNLVSLPTSVALHQVHKAIETADAIEEIDLATATSLRSLANTVLSGIVLDLRSKIARVPAPVREAYVELDKILDELAN